MKKYVAWIITLITLVSVICYFDEYISVSFLVGNEFNLITINTVLIGFLFTIYTILIPLLNEEALESYSITGEIDAVFNNISIGIQAGIFLVIFTSIGLLAFKVGTDSLLTKIHEFWLAVEISCFLIVILSTFLSLLNITKIVEDVRKNKTKKIVRKNNNNEMENRFKNNN